MLRSAKLITISLCVINPAYLETSTETIMERGIIEMEKIRRAIETKEIDLLNPETLEQVKKLLEEIKTALSIERQIDKEPETKDSEKANEPKAETPEQPKNDTQTEEVKSKETQPDPEQLKKLEELQKELEKELSSN